MPGLKEPGSEDCIKFLKAYFSGRRVEERTPRGDHFVLEVDGLKQAISVPMNRDRLAPGTFRNILRVAEIDRDLYLELAGNPAKLKKFLKSKKPRETNREIED